MDQVRKSFILVTRKTINTYSSEFTRSVCVLYFGILLSSLSSWLSQSATESKVTAPA